jgi:hypothetical protein
VNTRDGNVVRWNYLEGSFGIPAVAWDWSTGGLARRGQRLILVSPPGKWTRFLVVHPRTLRVRARFKLRGAWAFDALSPEGSLLYLIQYRGSPWATNASYAVRAYNLDTHRLYAGAIVDRREPDEKMNGIPMTRVGSPDASWAYTLYSKSSGGAFVHALHTTAREAFCVDLPLDLADEQLVKVRMRVGKHVLLLRLRRKTVAKIDTRTFHVTP